MSKQDVYSELADINAIPDSPGKPGLHAGPARILLANYVDRYESVCDDGATGAESMALEHFVNFVAEVARYAKAGLIMPTKEHARALKLVQYALNELGRIDLTEVAQTQASRMAAAMTTWCDLMERV